MRNVPSPSGLPVAGLACPGGAGLLRALPDPEGAESLWLLTLYANIGHDGLAGTVARPVHQVVNVFGWALEDCLDTAVGKVAHPSADAVLQRTPPTGVAEENTLNTARKHYPIADHKTDVTSWRCSDACGRRPRRSRRQPHMPDRALPGLLARQPQSPRDGDDLVFEQVKFGGREAQFVAVVASP